MRLQLVSHAATTAAAQFMPNFMCTEYVIGCDTFLNSIGCTSRVNYACGDPTNAALPATLDNWQGTCTCAAPLYYDISSERVAEEVWDAAMHTLVPSLLVPSAPPYSLPLPFQAVCTAALARLGCPPAASVININSTSADNTFACECGSATQFDIGSERAVEDIVDAILATNMSVLAAAPPVQPNNFTCDAYVPLCTYLLNAINCTSSVIAGCSSGTLDTMVGTCTCNAPMYVDIPGPRIQELLIDARIKANISSYLVGNVTASQYNMSASHAAAGTAALNLLGCPSSVTPTTSFTSTDVNNTFMDECGTFVATDGRVAEVITDQILSSFKAAAAAALIPTASPSPTASASPTGSRAAPSFTSTAAPSASAAGVGGAAVPVAPGLVTGAYVVGISGLLCGVGAIIFAIVFRQHCAHALRRSSGRHTKLASSGSSKFETVNPTEISLAAIGTTTPRTGV